MSPRLVALGIGVSLCSIPAAASAFTIESQLSSGCHEGMTARALRNLRGELDTAAPLPPSGDDGPMIDDLPFSVPADMMDIGGAALLIGVRDNDLKGRGAEGIDELSGIHGDPANQREHCLRSPDEDEPGGTASALVDCRAFIHERLNVALDGLDGNGKPDVNTRADVGVSLTIRGKIVYSLPKFYLEIGRAIHAIEDGFAHDLRSSDSKQVTVTLNWVDYVNGTLDQSRDGPAHMTEMDRCDDPDELRTTRHSLAEGVAESFLRIALDPSRTREQKLAAADDLVLEWFQPEPGCTSDNSWCNAPELQYEKSGCGCRTENGGSAPGGLTLAAMGALALVARRRRRLRAAAIVMGISGAVMMLPRLAPAQGTHAHAATSASTPASASAPTNTTTPQPSAQVDAPNIGAPAANKVSTNPVAQQGIEEKGGAVFGHLGAAVSYDKPAFAAQLGAKVALSTTWMIGLDAEINPWLSLDTKRVRTGAFNGYGSLIRRYQMRYEAVNLRTTLALGTSVLLIDLVGAPSGSVGLFAGVSPLGIEWKVARGTYVIIDPTYIAIPIPHLTGAPFGYTQYRFAVGLEFGGLTTPGGPRSSSV